MKKIAKLILTTIMISAPISFLLFQLQGIAAPIMALGLPFSIFSYLFVSRNNYEKSLENYVFPLIISLGILFVGLLVFVVLSANDGWAFLAAVFAVFYGFIPITIFSVAGSFLGRLFKKKTKNLELPSR